jgi:arylsulfatase A-like enzyme
MPPPNILIVMTDHQRGDTLLPGHPAKTPHLDRFAQQGITFRETYCPSPHCCPSRATFFTGLYPSRHGVWNNICNDQALSRGLKDGVRTWGEELVDAGYALHFCGKWHVSVEESPADRGWQEHLVSSAAGAHHGVPWSYYQELASQTQASDRREGVIKRPGYGPYRMYGTISDTNDSHDETAVAKAIEVLESTPQAGKPWCLFVGLIGPHDPYDVPHEYIQHYKVEDVPLPKSFQDDLNDKPRIYQRMRNQIFDQLSERETKEAVRHYWAYCSYLDKLFGRILEALDKSGQAEDTLVLYCADHGDYCGEHGLFAKGIPCFRGAYHIPAVLRWPRGLHEPGRSVDGFVSLADFGPTFVEAAGLNPDLGLTGRSLMPFLRGEEPSDWRDDIHTQCNGVELYYTQRSVMTREYKYIFNGFDQDELYDLRADPDEMHNLAEDPAYQDIKREMCGRMWLFAFHENDSATNSYITVGLAPYGPAEAFRDPGVQG